MRGVQTPPATNVMLRIRAGPDTGRAGLSLTHGWPSEACKGTTCPSCPSCSPPAGLPWPALPTVDLDGLKGSVWLSPSGCCENACFPGRTPPGTVQAGGWDCFKKRSRPHSKFGTQRLARATLGQNTILPLPSTGKHSVQLQSPRGRKGIVPPFLHDLITCLNFPTLRPRQ